LAFNADGFDHQRYERLRELAALLMAQGSAAEHDSILALLRQEKGYATPKVDVRGAAFQDGRVLMVREISDGKWTLPGGWADVNQSAGECVVREIAEESGFKARALKLAAIGTAAGLFSGLFGVGGGTVIVPLLVLWLGYGEREATGTSLAAIVFIAAFAAAVQGTYGNVHVRDGVLVGIPAVGGVLLGTWLQQRLERRVIALMFAAVLVATAVELLVQ